MAAKLRSATFTLGWRCLVLAFYARKLTADAARCTHDGAACIAAIGCTTIILQLDSSRECAKSRAVLLRSMPTPTIPFPRTHRQNGPPCRICGSLAELRRCASLSSASISPLRTHRVDLKERLHRRHQDYSWTCTSLRLVVRRYDRLTVIYVNEPRDEEKYLSWY